MRFTVLVFLLGVVSAFAGHNNITHTDVQKLPQLVIPAGQSATTVAFLIGQDLTTAQLTARSGLGKATDISALVQSSGSQNYKVEVLSSMDGVVFTKPETGGDLGTFLDNSPHFVYISPPLSPGGIKLRFTELGGSTALTASSTLAGQ